MGMVMHMGYDETIEYDQDEYEHEPYEEDYFDDMEGWGESGW